MGRYIRAFSKAVGGNGQVYRTENSDLWQDVFVQ